MESSEYLSKVTSAHFSKPKYMAWLKVLFDMLAGYGNAVAAIPAAFSLDSAVGKQLDWVGSLVGASRQLEYTSTANPSGELADNDFREYIRAKIIFNRWDGCNESLPALWQMAYPAIEMSYTDNQDMTMTVYLSGDIPEIMQELIQRGMLIPSPAGVRMEYNITSENIPALDVPVRMGYFESAEIDMPNEAE